MAASNPRLRSAWPDLPADLLGVVLRRLTSLADRVRLRAVCRPWRTSAAPMLHLSPPQLPWLAFHDGTLLDVSNNTAHAVRLPDDGATSYCAGENMLFLLHGDGGCSLMDTFSGEATPLPELAALLKSHGVKSTEIMKAVTSSTPRLVAVVFNSCSCSGVLASTWRPDGKINSWQVLVRDGGYLSMIFDIAIFEGKMYAISMANKLLAVELNDAEEEQTARFVKQIGGTIDLPIRPYLVESNGKLLMVRRWEGEESCNGMTRKTRKVDVVEADLSLGQWNKVDGLEGQALFVSRLCSKSVPATATGAQQDGVYFPHEYQFSGDLRESAAYKYSLADRTITPLMPEQPATVLPWNIPCPHPAWFFPVEG